MAKLMIKASGLLALTFAYATGAWAATVTCDDETDPSTGQLEVCVQAGPKYASDLFGPGSDDVVLGYQNNVEKGRDDSTTPVTPCVFAGTNGPMVLIEPAAAVTGGAEITYTVTGAEFAGRVRNTDVVAMHNEGSITPKVIEGGAVGDSSVTFEVQATGLVYSNSWDPDGSSADCVADDHQRPSGNQKAVIAFRVPELTSASGAMTTTGVLVSVDVDPTGTGFPVYPARGQTVPDGEDPGTEADKDSGVRTLLAKAKTRGLTVKGAPGTDGTINPEERETLLAATGLPLKPQQLAMGTVTVGLNTGVAQANGADFSVENPAGRKNDGDGAGVLMVSATGDFRAGDMVYWDDGNGKYDAGAETDTMLEIDEGVASTEFDLADVAPGAHTIYYVPNGKDALRSGSIATSYSVAFSNATNATPLPGSSMLNLNYRGAKDALLAYAIAPPSNPDESNIRIRCDRSTPCQVYLACDGADGMGYFGKMDAKIGPRMVETVTAMELAEVIGADDADFAGRMSCEVIGSSISVQVLTRSGGALVNNTYVGGPLEAQVRQSINEAMAATVQAEAAGATAIAVRCAQLLALTGDDVTDAVTAEIKALACGGA